MHKIIKNKLLFCFSRLHLKDNYPDSLYQEYIDICQLYVTKAIYWQKVECKIDTINALERAGK